MDQYTLNLNEYIPDDGFGPVSPSAPAPLREREKMGFGEAIIQDTPAFRVGQMVAEKFIADDTPDPNYDPFQAWKDAGADDSVLSDYMDTENQDQLFRLTMRLNESKARRESIEAAGFAGETANFLMNIAADPTTYFGFGSAMMLKGGMGALKAGAISGGLAGAAMSAQQEFYAPEEMTLERGVVVTAATTVMGGLLGKAVDSFAGLQSKGLIKKDFDKMSTDALTDAADVAQRADAAPQSVGAAVVPDLTYNASVGGNAVARALSKAMAKTQLSPRMAVQNFESQEGARIASRMFGTSVKTVGNIEGVAGKEAASFSEITQEIRDQTVGKIEQNFNKDFVSKRFGRIATDADYEIVHRALHDEKVDISKLDPLQRHYYDWQQAFYKEKAEQLAKDKVPYFNERHNYGAPVIFSKEKVSAKIDDFKKIAFDGMKRVRDGAQEQINKVKKEIKDLELRIKDYPDPRDNAWMRAAIERKAGHLEELFDIARASDQDLAEDASIAANKIATGIFYDELLLGPAVVNKSRFFKERHVNPLDYMDFLEHDPKVLASKYTDSVAPHMAFAKAFPEYRNIQAMAEDLKSRILGDNKLQPDKAAAEAEKAVALVTRAWNSETGIELSQKVTELGAAAPWVSAMNDAMYMTQMGGQVLASLVEPVGITLHHGLKGGAHYGKVAAALAKDPALREASKKELNYMGIAIEAAKNKLLQDQIGYEIMERQLGNKISRVFRKGALLMGRANLSTSWDTMTRGVLAVAQSGLMKERLLKFSKLSKEELADLAFLGIDKKNVKAITEQLKLHGKDERGIFLANIENWTDQAAKDAWIRAIRKDSRRTSVQADTGDVPFLFRTPLGKLFTKYKTWSVAASQKLLIQAAQNPKGSAAGVAAMVSAGTLLDVILQASQGKEFSTDPDELLWGGINRSGILGVLPEAGGSFLLNRLAGVQSGGGRFYQYQDVPGLVFGATGNFLQDVATLGGAALPKYSDENGYKFGFLNEDGDLKKGVVNSVVDVLPIPIAKPWLRAGAQELVE